MGQCAVIELCGLAHHARHALVTPDTTVYQSDRTHLMANGYVNHLGSGATALLDQFWGT